MKRIEFPSVVVNEMCDPNVALANLGVFLRNRMRGLWLCLFEAVRWEM